MGEDATWADVYARWLGSLPPLRVSRIESIAGCFIWMGGENWNFSPETLVRVLGGDGRVVLSDGTVIEVLDTFFVDA